jgi:hypothetical protein
VAEVDFSVLKNTTLRERLKLQFSREFFDILKSVSFNTRHAVGFKPATSVPLPTAGLIAGTSTTSRQIQFVLKPLW